MDKRELGPFLAVRAIILNKENNKVLLLKRADNDKYGEYWCLPGGKVDFGETAEEAIVREIMEETSLRCNSVKFLFYQDNLPQKDEENQYLTLYFYCDVKGEIKLNKESSQFAWITFSEINKYDIAFKNDEAIRMYWKDQNKLL